MPNVADLYRVPIRRPDNTQYLDRKGRYNTTAFRNRFIDAMDPAQRTAQSTEADYLRRARSYDPQESFERSAGAARAGYREQLQRDLRDEEGAAVGAGRLDTGFYDEDRGEVMRRSDESFNRELAGMALNTEGLRLRNQEGLGQYSQFASNRYLDLMAGGLDRAEAEAEAKRRRGGGFGRFLGTVAGGVGGFLVGGPAGAAAGAGVGNKAFS
jgi:hypothetical protein